MIISTLWETYGGQHILGKNIISSKFCGKNMIGSTFWEKEIIVCTVWGENMTDSTSGKKTLMAAFSGEKNMVGSTFWKKHNGIKFNGKNMIDSTY
jgi:hypothetical protein